MAKLYLGLVLYTGYHQWRWGKVLRQKFTRMMMYHPYLTQLLTIGLHRMNGRITFSYNRINHKNIRYCAYPNWIWCSASCPHLLTLSPRPCLLSKPEPLLTPRHNHPPPTQSPATYTHYTIATSAPSFSMSSSTSFPTVTITHSTHSSSLSTTPPSNAIQHQPSRRLLPHP